MKTLRGLFFLQLQYPWNGKLLKAAEFNSQEKKTAPQAEAVRFRR